MTDTIDTHLADLRLVCAAIEREVANLRAVFKSQRDAAQQAEARALKQAEDSRAGWADENAAKCRAQSNCAIARASLPPLPFYLTRSIITGLATCRPRWRLSQ